MTNQSWRMTFLRKSGNMEGQNMWTHLCFPDVSWCFQHFLRGWKPLIKPAGRIIIGRMAHNQGGSGPTKGLVCQLCIKIDYCTLQHWESPNSDVNLVCVCVCTFFSISFVFLPCKKGCFPNQVFSILCQSKCVFLLARFQNQKYEYNIPSGKRHSYWKWQFIVDLPIKNGDIPWLC